MSFFSTPKNTRSISAVLNHDTSVEDILFEANGSECFTVKKKKNNNPEFQVQNSCIHTNDQSRFSALFSFRNMEHLLEDKIDEVTEVKGNLKVYHSFLVMEIDFLIMCENCMKL